MTTQRASRRTSAQASRPGRTGWKIRSSVQLSTVRTRASATPPATTRSRMDGAVTATASASRSTRRMVLAIANTN